MTVHNLKTWPQYFAAIVSGKKTFEIRNNDRNFKIGDRLILREFAQTFGNYTGRVWVVIITYIMEGGAFGIDSSRSVLGIRQLSTAEIGINQNVIQQTLPGSEDYTKICPKCKHDLLPNEATGRHCFSCNCDWDKSGKLLVA